MPTTFDLPHESATSRLGALIGAALAPGDAILLEGPLGAGKTTLARALLRAACHDPQLVVPSPTYTLTQEYDSPMGPITHFDLWRLDGPAALDELGWDEARAGIVLVEWPDRLGAARPEGALSISLEATDDETRRACLDGWPAARLAPLTTGRAP